VQLSSVAHGCYIQVMNRYMVDDLIEKGVAEMEINHSISTL
jgi:hypothetical protein